MAFPLIPIICALALYILHDSDTQPDAPVKENKRSPRGKPNSGTQKSENVKENNSVEITQSDIDDKSKTVPVSATPAPENSVPTPEPSPETENVQ